MKEKKSDIVAKKAVENNDSRATSVWFAEAVDFYRLRIGMLHQFKVFFVDRTPDKLVKMVLLKK